MPMLLMETDQARTTQQELMQMAMEIEQEGQLVSRSTQQLVSVWEGQAAHLFDDEMQQMAQYTRTIFEQVNELATRLQNEIDEWEEVASTFSGGGGGGFGGTLNIGTAPLIGGGLIGGGIIGGGDGRLVPMPNPGLIGGGGRLVPMPDPGLIGGGGRYMPILFDGSGIKGNVPSLAPFAENFPISFPPLDGNSNQAINGVLNQGSPFGSPQGTSGWTQPSVMGWDAITNGIGGPATTIPLGGAVPNPNGGGFFADVWGDVGGFFGDVGTVAGDVSGFLGQVGEVAGDVVNFSGNVVDIAGNVSEFLGDLDIGGDFGGFLDGVGDFAGGVGDFAGDIGGIAGDVGGIASQIGGFVDNVGGIADNIGDIIGGGGGIVDVVSGLGDVGDIIDSGSSIVDSVVDVISGWW